MPEPTDTRAVSYPNPGRKGKNEDVLHERRGTCGRTCQSTPEAGGPKKVHPVREGEAQKPTYIPLPGTAIPVSGEGVVEIAEKQGVDLHIDHGHKLQKEASEFAICPTADQLFGYVGGGAPPPLANLPAPRNLQDTETAKTSTKKTEMTAKKHTKTPRPHRRTR